MAKQKRPGQSWWPVYALALMMVGLLILAHRVAPSPGWRIFLEVGTVIASYGLMAWWLETHSTTLLDRSPAEADSLAINSPEIEIIPPSLSSHVQCHLYVGSGSAIVYSLSKCPTSNLRSNGCHHPIRPISVLPEEASE